MVLQKYINENIFSKNIYLQRCFKSTFDCRMKNVFNDLDIQKCEFEVILMMSTYRLKSHIYAYRKMLLLHLDDDDIMCIY